MRNQTFNPDMLRIARDRLGITQAELATKSGFTQALISKLENGLIQEAPQETVKKLSGVLSLPPDFFFQPDRGIGLSHYHYRKRAKVGAKTLAQLEAVVNIHKMHVKRLLRSYELETIRPIPQIDLDETGMTPEEVADRLREYWLISRGPIPNLVELIEDAGGIVLLANFGTQRLEGISFRLEGMPPLIFMNSGISGDRFRIALAQELAHMVMHTLPDNDEKMEEEARRFAFAFLLPEKDIRPYLSSPQLSSFGRVKAFWKVSIWDLVNRAIDLKRITPSQHKSLISQYKKAFRAGEPIPLTHENPRRLKDMVRHHIEVLGYSITDLSKLLCILPRELQMNYTDKPEGLRLVVAN